MLDEGDFLEISCTGQAPINFTYPFTKHVVFILCSFKLIRINYDSHIDRLLYDQNANRYSTDIRKVLTLMIPEENYGVQTKINFLRTI